MPKRLRSAAARPPSKHLRPSLDEEILSSDSDQEKPVPIEEKDDFFEPETGESPEETRIRMAKEMISQAEAQIQGEEDPEAVTEKLRTMEEEREGKVMREAAERVRGKETFGVTFLKGHISAVTCVAVSPDGSHCVTGSKDCSLLVWNLTTLTKQHLIKGLKHDRKSGGHFDEVLCVKYTDDGKYFISSGKDRIIRVWNGKTYEPVHTFKGHRDTVTGLAVHKNHNTLYTVSADRSINIWNLTEMLLMNTLYGHQRTITAVDSFHSERLVTASEDGSVRVWKAIEDSQFVFSSLNSPIDCICVLTEDLFLSGSQDGSLHLWQTTRKKPIFSLISPHDGHWVTSVASLRGTNLAASGSSNGKINLYSVSDSKVELLNAVPVQGYINGLEFTRDGKRLVAAVAQDMRLGRWMESRKVKNGVTVIDLEDSLQA